MKVIIDRIEERYAIVELEDGTVTNLPVIFLPSEAKEGDIIQIEINQSATEERRKYAANLVDEIFED